MDVDKHAGAERVKVQSNLVHSTNSLPIQNPLSISPPKTPYIVAALSNQN